MNSGQAVHLYELANRIPSMGGMKIGPVLRQVARDAPGGTSIVEVGCWLGAGTAQLALGLREREREGRVSLHCFDRWQAQPVEIAKVAKKGVSISVLENTLPPVQRTLEPFEVPIQFHQGDLMHARWEGSPISVYVDDASKTLPFFSRSLATFAPFWVPGETVILLMDFYLWEKTGVATHQCQQRFVEAFSDCIAPIEDADRFGQTSLAMFRYTAPLGTEAWTWLLKQSSEAVAVAEYETRRSQIRIADLRNKIRSLHNSTSWRITAPLRRCADGLRGIFGHGGSSKG